MSLDWSPCQSLNIKVNSTENNYSLHHSGMIYMNVLLVYWPTLLVESNGQGWVHMLVRLLVMYQSLSKILCFGNVNNCIWYC